MLGTKFKKHTAKVTGQLRSININDPRKYYQILNQAVKQKTPNDLPIDEFEEHFKNLNTTEQENLNETENVLNATNSELDFTEDLNRPVTEAELEKALKSLKNNKATGPDKIMNEEIKGTFREMKDVYLKLFNLIFDSGCYPVAWAEGLIIPIYKKKGSRNDANNYRGITLISCMAKFFFHSFE